MAVNTIFQNSGFLITFLSVCLNILACADRQWRKNDPSREVLEQLVRSTGLWERCTFQATGHYQCDYYDNFFIGLPTLLMGARVFTCMAILFGFFACLIQIVGLDCVKIAEDQRASKAKCVVVAGFLAIFSGILMCIGVSWFAAEVFQNYYNPMRGNINPAFMQGNRQNYQLDGNEQYIYGRALFVGWSSSIIAIIGGVLSICSSWGAMRDDDEFDNYDQPNYNTNGYTGGNKNMDREYL